MKIVIFIFSSLLLLPHISRTEMPPAISKQPNILFIAIDDMRPQTSSYGLDFMITPHLDRFASEARQFNRHYVQVPTCGPSRACLLTGRNLRQPSEISHTHLRSNLKETTPTQRPESIIHHFKQNGYHTIGLGKISHHESGGNKPHPNQPFQYELPYSWHEYLHDTGSRWGPQPQLHTFAFGKTRETHAMPPYEATPVEDTDYPDGRLANRAITKLHQLAETKRPFFMAVGFFKPHLPFSAPQKYWDLYDRKTLPLSPNPNATPDISNVFLHPSNEIFNRYTGGKEKGGIGKRLSDDYARTLIHGYCASVSYVDAQIGRLLDNLKKSGLAQNTIVVIWGDHGWLLGDRTIWGKHCVFDRALRSLLMVKIPHQKHPGQSTDALVATIDLYPTLCELAQLPTPDNLDGTSFVPALHQPSHPGKSHIFSYWRNTLSLKTDQYRYSLHRIKNQQADMLFDHTSDPNETRNIANQQPQTAEKLKQLLLLNNPGFLPDHP